jgi:protein-disulfide isomerase
MTRNKIIIAVGALVLIALGGGAWLLFSPQDAATATGAPADGANFTITASDRTMGNPKAPVVLIEYAAPVCPHCAAFEIQDFPQLKAKYIDSGKVFYVFRVFPIRPGDGPAEKLASCLPPDRYFSFIDLLFRNQQKWDADEFPGADIQTGLVQMGRIAGMSADQVEACINNKADEDRINKVAAEGDTRYHITGTPTFVVDGVPGQGGEELPGLQQRLDAALAAKKPG